MKNVFKFTLSNEHDIAQLKIARLILNDYFNQYNVDDENDIMSSIDTIIESLNETHYDDCVTIQKIVNDHYNDIKYIKKSITFCNTCDMQCDYIFDQLSHINHVLNDDQLNDASNKMYMLNDNDFHNENENEIDEIKMFIIERIEKILTIKIL